MEDLQLLALLVHRGHLTRPEAERVLPALKAGGELDTLLLELPGWDDEKVARMRRTRAGEIPEIPGFRIKQKLGTGGTAEVFLAQEKKGGAQLALKILKPAAVAHAPTRKAFIAEARLLERLDHEGLVGCSGIAKSGQTYFSKLQHLEGKTVLEHLDADRRFEEREALQVVLDVAKVLSYLLAEGIVHRDVKPGNMILVEEKDAERTVLIDLGFAAEETDTAAQSETADGTTQGTVAYLSPEQARGAGGPDLRSDIYSLGVSLFHIAIGHLPFEASDDRELLRMQVMEHLSAPELKGRGFSQHLHYFIEKMMAKEAQDRYQSWEELIRDVEDQLRGADELDFESQVRAKGSGRTRPGRGRRLR